MRKKKGEEMAATITNPPPTTATERTSLLSNPQVSPSKLYLSYLLTNEFKNHDDDESTLGSPSETTEPSRSPTKFSVLAVMLIGKSTLHPNIKDGRVVNGIVKVHLSPM
jgi:hypothetical protein